MKDLRRCAVPSVFAILMAAGHVYASTTVCVSTAAELQTALTTAQTATSATFIDVVSGTYLTADNGGNPFTFQTSTNAQQVDVAGGYNVGCSAHIEDPTLTVLDGGAASSVMYMQNNGGVSLRWLTIRNGSNPLATAGVRLGSVDGSVIVNYNIISGNVSSEYGDGGIFIGVEGDANGTGNITLWGNLIVGNASGNGFSALRLVNGGKGSIYFTNNTVADNTVTVGTSPQNGGAQFFAALGRSEISNSIFWNNVSASNSADVNIGRASDLVDNDVDVLNADTTPTVDTDLSVDPAFVAPGRYLLKPTSPLFGIGSISPPDGLPTIDIRALARTFNGQVDLGAYEQGDDIFRDGFDD
jgi:hypothetical protein